jgi:hypothetical protein
VHWYQAIGYQAIGYQAMDKLLTVREKCAPVDVPLAVRSEPSTSYENASYCPLAECFRKWLCDEMPDVGFVSGSVGGGISTLLKSMFRESNIDPHYIDPCAKNFTELLEDSAHVTKSLLGKRIVVVVDGVDSSSGKRIVGILSEHAKKNARHKILYAGHGEKKLTSNDFANKWRRFDFPPPSEDAVMRALKRISDGRVTDVLLAQIARNNAGDVRSCINSLEMHLKQPTGSNQYRDAFIDGIDAIKYVFQNEPIPCVRTLFKVYEQEPAMVKNGVFENYLNFFTSIDAVSRISESMSAGDALYGHEHEDTYAECAYMAGDAKLATKTKRGVVEKYGTLWSKMNTQKMNEKKLKIVSEKIRERGGIRIPVEDLDFLRNIVREDFSGRVLGEKEFLPLFRTGLRKYTHDKKKFNNLSTPRHDMP